jgi:hypothetical protein
MSDRAQRRTGYYIARPASTTVPGVTRLATGSEAKNSTGSAVISAAQHYNLIQTQQELLASGLWVVSRFAQAAGANLVAASGVVYLVPFVGVEGTIAAMEAYSANAASGLTLAKMGIYTAPSWVDGQTPDYTGAALVAQTGSFTAWSANSVLIENLTAPYALVPGQKYFAAIIQVGTTPATIRAAATQNALTRMYAPQQCLQLTGQTDLPASLAVLDTTSFGIAQPRIGLKF